ncbi:MAG: hypothetical protein GX597_14020 [Anaerolineaceae bacterium]|nr:hypothetical protein [Anaerolineaceae bacterium]
MRMIMAVVPHEQAETVLNKLIEAGYTATFMESRGGMLRQSQLTMFVAVEAQNLDQILEIIRENSSRQVPVASEAEGQDPEQRSIQALLGGAAIFVWDLSSIEVNQLP